MSLLRRIVQRLAGVSTPETPSAQRPAEGREGRRRRRGGRGRGANGARTEQGAAKAPAAAQPAPRGAGRFRRRTLEEPLPEDVAFPPAAEGGDVSIVPPRRRRGAGQRAIDRVVSAEIRHYVTRPEHNGAPPVAVAPEAAGPAAEPTDEAPPAERKRRRRGRRGGRGRRRPGQNGSLNGTP